MHGNTHTWEHYKSQIVPVCSLRGYCLLGFVSPYKGSRTKLKLLCKEHGEDFIWETTTIQSFISSGCGCPKCKQESVAMFNKTKPRKKKPTIPTALERRYINKGLALTWTEAFCIESNNDLLYKCPICSHDEYVLAGVCTGIFKMTSLNSKACRCALRSYRWTQAQREYQIQKNLANTNKVFKCWVEKYVDAKSRFIITCAQHGDYKAPSIEKASCCPSCKDTNSRFLYIHLLQYDGDRYLKVGITNDVERRVKQQKNKAECTLTPLYSWDLITEGLARTVESEVKTKYRGGVLGPEIMQDGFTETFRFQDLEGILATIRLLLPTQDICK